MLRVDGPEERPSFGAEAAAAGLAALRCRDDILQAMFWLRGEGFANEGDEESLARFLGVDAALVRDQLAVLTRDGFLEQVDDRFLLSEVGVQEGGRRFADEFADLQLTAHGECPPDCPHCEGIDRASCSHCGIEPSPRPPWA
ncbi:MAG: hypothetical protein H0V36_00810 [Chloroflexi bacterium]|nr:hypothetical protein [Chloroflexota bacterium]